VTRKVILDCDPGHDDAVAILMALAAPAEIELLGLTTVAGNAPVELTQRNARRVCDLAGRHDVKVYAGCSRPLVRAPMDAASVHGETGIDGLPPGEVQTPLQDAHAVDFIIETLLTADDDSVTLACLAPLTNIAIALVKEPRILPKIREVVLMGGARREGGNVTPAATFNMLCDPHAAHVVLECGRPIVAVGLDVTFQVLTSKARLAAIEAVGNPVAQAVHDMLAVYDARRIRKYGYTTDGASLNDPCVVAYLLQPALFEGQRVNIAVELGSELTMGMTVIDVWKVTSRPPNALWLHGVDAAGIYQLLLRCLARY
jgi:purine nucleosidase